MLFRIRVEHYRNKQAKTFGSQVVESAVCAPLQPPLERGFGFQSSGPLKENNTAVASTQHCVAFLYYWKRDCLQFPVLIKCLLT